MFRRCKPQCAKGFMQQRRSGGILRLLRLTDDRNGPLCCAVERLGSMRIWSMVDSEHVGGDLTRLAFEERQGRTW